MSINTYGMISCTWLFIMWITNTLKSKSSLFLSQTEIDDWEVYLRFHTSSLHHRMSVCVIVFQRIVFILRSMRWLRLVLIGTPFGELVCVAPLARKFHSYRQIFGQVRRRKKNIHTLYVCTRGIFCCAEHCLFVCFAKLTSIT